MTYLLLCKETEDIFKHVNKFFAKKLEANHEVSIRSADLEDLWYTLS